MIKTIIFDIANVQLTLEDEEFCKTLSKVFSIDFGRIFPIYNKNVIANEYGKITEIKLYSNMYNKLGIKPTGRLIQWTKNLRDECKHEMFGTRDLIVKLKQKGYTLGIASNDAKESSIRANVKFGFDNVFDFRFYSFMAKTRKTSKIYFKTLIEKHHLNPKECLFIDDGKRYIELAKEIGLNAILFINIDKLKKDLTNIGINS